MSVCFTFAPLTQYFVDQTHHFPPKSFLLDSNSVDGTTQPLGTFDSSLSRASCIQLVAKCCRFISARFSHGPSSFHPHCYLPRPGAHYLLPYGNNLTDLSPFKSLSIPTFPT